MHIRAFQQYYQSNVASFEIRFQALWYIVYIGAGIWSMGFDDDNCVQRGLNSM